MKRIHFSYNYAPLALLVLAAISFGLLIPKLGFYWDDWSSILILRNYDSSTFWKFFAYDRPTNAWSYVLFAKLLGSAPLPWHLFTFTFRWLTSVLMWLTLTTLWKNSPRPALLASSLFLIYPVFTQQSLAVTYHQLWMEFAFFFTSLWFTLLAQRKVKFSFLFISLALIALLLNLSISEYFLGLEVIRPLCLWILFQQEKRFPERGKRIWAVIRQWLPFLLITILFVGWRLLFAHPVGGDPNKPYILLDFMQQPLGALKELAQNVLQDIAYILIACWYQTFQPSLFIFSTPSIWLSWGVTLGCALVMGFIFLRIEGEDLESAEGLSHWSRQAMFIGCVALILGPLPAWSTGRHISQEFFSDRFGVVAMFGVSLFWVGVLEGLIPNINHGIHKKALIIACCLGLAAGFHLRTANDYRWFWVQQTRTYWQIAWRAPAIDEPTALIAPDEIFPRQGRFATSLAINLLYPPSANPDFLPYWVISLNSGYRGGARDLVMGKELDEAFRNFKFKSFSKDSLVVLPEPQEGACLWILKGKERNAGHLPPLVMDSLKASNINRIHPQPVDPAFPPVEIFGPPPTDNWCYFFQKADLARQTGDWEAILTLEGQATARGYSPSHYASRIPYEWLPFIQAHLAMGEWDKAKSLVFQISAAKLHSDVDPYLCATWQNITESLPESAEKQRATREILLDLRCEDN